MDPSLAAFRDVVRASDQDMDLGRAAFAVAQVEHPDLVPERHLPFLDDLADRSGAASCRDHGQALSHLLTFLFEDEGFRGNADDYYDPRNSCLNDVLDRKLGIPITLSVLLIEVGRRVGLHVDGIGLPGHFVVSARLAAGPVLIDPFHAGTRLTPTEAAATVARAMGRPVELVDAHWRPCTKRQILIRMLRNLKTIYGQREEWERALAVVDRLLLLDAESPVHLRDRGTVLVRLGRCYEGVAEWERYLTRHPGARDAEGVRRELQRVRQDLASRN